MHHSTKRLLVGSAAAVGTLSLCATLAWIVGFRLNTTPSFPIGIWQLVDGPPQRGDIVFFRPDDSNPAVKWGRGVGILPWHFGRPPLMLKKIVAAPGDTVTVTDCVLVNGTPVPRGRIFALDPAGRAIPSTAVAGVIPPGTWWLMSDFNERSFDSRYFGPVKQAAVIGRAVPVWLW